MQMVKKFIRIKTNETCNGPCKRLSKPYSGINKYIYIYIYGKKVPMQKSSERIQK